MFSMIKSFVGNKISERLWTSALVRSGRRKNNVTSFRQVFQRVIHTIETKTDTYLNTTYGFDACSNVLMRALMEEKKTTEPRSVAVFVKSGSLKSEWASQH